MLTCHSCGCGGRPVKFLILTQRTGLLVVRYTHTYKGDFCRPCGRKMLARVQLHNLFLGWWGTVSFFLNPPTIVGNFYTYIRTPRRKEPIVRRMV